MNSKLAWFATPALAALSLYASALDVDRFTTEQGRYDDTTADSNPVGGSVGTDDATILGGNRDLFANLLGSSGFGGEEVWIKVYDGKLFLANTAGASGSGLVQWDGTENTRAIDATGLGGIDLTSGGKINSFRLEFLFCDQEFEAVIKAWEDTGHWTAISLSVPRVMNGPRQFTIPFGAFTDVALCGSSNPTPGVNSITCGNGNTQPVDLTRLGALELALDPNGLLTAFDCELGSITTPTDPGESEAQFEYAAKIICGVQKDPSDMALAPGRYATAINVRNPGRKKIEFTKTLALTVPPGEQLPGPVKPIALDTLDAGEALEVDCNDVGKKLFDGEFPAPYIKGFVVLKSPASLDVTAVYTVGALDEEGRYGASSIDVETIPERTIPKPHK